MLKILTIDDSRVMRQMLEATLTGAGHSSVQASDGLEGLESLDGNDRFDLIITDINMPRLDGFGFIERARQHPTHRTTPILVLSTESSEDKKARARNAGASGWIVKPFNSDTLLRAVRRVTAG
jgi:two-component system chemotaxis response regulator CheY